MPRINLNKLIKDGHYQEALEAIQSPTRWSQKTLDSALYKAACSSRPELVRALLDRGAAIDSQSPPNSATALYAVVNNGDHVSAALLVERGAAVNLATIKGVTPLHAAAVNGYDKLVALLLAAGADVERQASKTGRTPLHAAALGGSLVIIQRLLDYGAALEQMDVKGDTALALAAWKGHLAAVELLLAAGAAVEGVSAGAGRTPLYLAALNGHAAVVALLLARGASATARGSVTADAGRTPLHAAAAGGHLAVVTLLLAHGASARVWDHNGCSPLCQAVQTGSAELVDTLLAHGADANSRPVLRHQTPLHYAAAAGRSDFVQRLLAHGAIVEMRNPDGFTPLHLAVEHVCKTAATDLTLVELLLKAGANPDAGPPPRGPETAVWRPFPFVVYHQHRQLAELLHAYGADINKPGCTKERLALTAVEAAVAATLRHADKHNLLEWLLGLKADLDSAALLPTVAYVGDLALFDRLIAAGADVRAPGVVGAAVDKDRADLLRALVERGADIEAPYDMPGRTSTASPLELAIRFRPDLVLPLVELGANLRRMIERPDALPQTYADVARAALGDSKSVQRLMILDLVAEQIAARLSPASIQYRDLVAREFAERVRQDGDGTWVIWEERIVALRRKDQMKAFNETDGAGEVPLAHLLRRGELAKAAKLYASGANINQRNRFGRTPLHWAVIHRQEAAVAKALEWGADIHAATNHGYTALHYAAQTGRVSLVRMLLRAGADPAAQLSAQRLKGWTALHFAFACADHALVGLLYPLTPSFDPPAVDAHRLTGTYNVVMGHNDWHKPHPISPKTRCCPTCGEDMVYNTSHTFDDSGHMADRIEIHVCASCGARYWEKHSYGRQMPLNPWETFVQY